jgi:hypothetical protein
VTSRPIESLGDLLFGCLLTLGTRYSRPTIGASRYLLGPDTSRAVAGCLRSQDVGVNGMFVRRRFNFTHFLMVTEFLLRQGATGWQFGSHQSA